MFAPHVPQYVGEKAPRALLPCVYCVFVRLGSVFVPYRCRCCSCRENLDDQRTDCPHCHTRQATYDWEVRGNLCHNCGHVLAENVLHARYMDDGGGGVDGGRPQLPSLSAAELVAPGVEGRISHGDNMKAVTSSELLRSLTPGRTSTSYSAPSFEASGRFP